MKKLFYGCLALMLAASCGERGTRTGPSETATMEAELSDTAAAESPEEETQLQLVKEQEVPATADESFADFFFNFASDDDFQKERIVFPISYYKGEEVLRTTRDDWQHDSLLSRSEVYTVMFDSDEDMYVEEDTSLTSVQVDMIYLVKRRVKRYYFERINDRWYLEAINMEPVTDKSDDTEDFFTFYSRFATDSVFQRERLHDPLAFVTADPEDDFSILETTLDVGQWFAFRPPLLQEWLSNIHYGQPSSVDSRQKILEIKGFGNGFCNTLFFNLRQGLWRLMKFEDLSD